MIIDATQTFGRRSSAHGTAAACPPAEAHPTLLWKVMARLDQYDRRRTLTRRYLAATTLAAATVVIRRRARR